MDVTIYRKPETRFNHTFEEVVQMAKNARKNPNAEVYSYVCENFPKNSFVRVNRRGVFNIYHIRGDGEIISGGKCTTSLRLVDGMWATCKRLEEIFCALNYDTGMKMELGEVRRKAIEERKNRQKDKNPPFPSVHPEMDVAEVKTEEISIGAPVFDYLFN